MTPVLSTVVGTGISIRTLIPSMLSPKPDCHIYSCLGDFVGVEEGSVVNENEQRKNISVSKKKLTFSCMKQKGVRRLAPLFTSDVPGAHSAVGAPRKFTFLTATSSGT